RSRVLLRATFFVQYSWLELGARRHAGQPCQKQPSTNTATRRSSKTKSGHPATSLACMRHPRIPDRTRRARNTRSVHRLPVDFPAAMVRERTDAETLSIYSYTGTVYEKVDSPVVSPLARHVRDLRFEALPGDALALHRTAPGRADQVGGGRRRP